MHHQVLRENKKLNTSEKKNQNSQVAITYRVLYIAIYKSVICYCSDHVSEASAIAEPHGHGEREELGPGGGLHSLGKEKVDQNRCTCRNAIQTWQEC